MKLPSGVRDGRILQRSGLGIALVYLVSLLVRRGSVSPWCDGVLFPAGFAACAASCLIFAPRSVAYRRCWRLMGTAFALSAFGWATAGYHLFAHQPQPFPSISDAGWIGVYVFGFLAIVDMICRLRLQRGALPLMFDSAVAGLGTASVLAWFEIPRLHLPDADWLTKAVTVAYPGGELFVFAALVALIIASGFRAGPMIWVSTGAMLILAVANCVFGSGIEGGFAEGTWINGGWLLALGIVACYSGTSPTTRQQRASTPWLAGLISCSAVLSSMVLMVVHGAGLRHDVVTPLAVATIAVAVARLALSQRDAQVLADSRQLARTDELTNLANRRGFQHRAARALADPLRTASILMIDLDAFKDINDGLGHSTGDALLTEIGHRLAPLSRGPILIARIGGDEFAVLIENAGPDAATTVAEQIRHLIGQSFAIHGLDLRIEASVGIATAPDHGTTTEELMRKADIAMYAAKAGRLAVVVYMDDGGAQQAALRTVAELRHAIENDPAQLVLYYQPKIDLRGQTLAGVEALIRWAHPARGLMPPVEFLPLAAKAHLMTALTDRVLQRAVADMASWAGSTLAGTKVAVNLPPESVNDPGLVDRITGLLRAAGLPASALQVEITEEFLVADVGGARCILQRLRDAGIGVSIDDYGTGYSSLAYLRDLPVDELKLDRTFIAALIENPRSAAIVSSTVVLAQSLGLSMVAEGIEDGDTLTALTLMGCDIGQGYFLCRPQPPGELADAVAAMLDRMPVPPPVSRPAAYSFAKMIAAR